MAYHRFITALDAISTVMKSMGLGTPTSAFGSTDKTIQQFFTLANEAGEKLLDEHDWQFGDAEMTITTVVGVSTYALPAEFNGFYEDAAWNRTTRLPAIGSLDQYEWQMLKARSLAGTTFTMLFRINNNQVEFYEVPSTVQTIVLPYHARGWCTNAGGTIRQDQLAADDDIILYDPVLFKIAVKRAWFIEKQFDTTRVEVQYQDALSRAKGKDVPGRTLSLGRKADYPYLGVINIPDAGYGS